MVGKMRYIFLLMVVFTGCDKAKPIEVKADPPLVAVQYVNTVTALLQTQNSSIVAVKDEVRSNTDLLREIKTLVEKIPVEADAPETPSTQTKLASTVEIPTLYVSSIEGCAPCRKLERDYKAGKFHPFKVVFRPDPDWTGEYPVIRWEEGGQWKCFGTLVKDKDGNMVVQSHGYDSKTVDQLKARFGIWTK